MESARSAFHAQLATVMDSLLAAAVCEIAKIFESSLSEQQAELVQRSDEISLLRARLDRAERRQGRAKGAGGGGEEGDSRTRTVTGSGLTVGKDVSSQSDPAAVGFSQSLSGLKEEVTGPEGASVKHERAGSHPPVSVSSRASEGSLSSAVNQRQNDTLSSTQAKAKSSQWDQVDRGADHRPLQDQSSSPFLSISQSGQCSPRPDPTGMAQQGEWLPGLDANRGAAENLQQAADGTGTDTPCFRPAFSSEETSNEDSSFPFLDQEPENQNSSNQNSAQGQGVGQRSARQAQAQPPSGESQWGPRGPVNHTRRLTGFSSRDPLRPQSNSQSLTLRHANTPSHPVAIGGGNGRPYTCPYCTKCFTYPSHQRRHLLRHTGVRLHPCQFCDKSFLTPSELTVHTRTHTGERPFGCAQCGKRFARSGNLRAHQRDVHMGKRPFACVECGKRFAHRGNLRVHNHRVHQGDPYYMDNQQEPDMGSNPI